MANYLYNGSEFPELPKLPELPQHSEAGKWCLYIVENKNDGAEWKYKLFALTSVMVVTDVPDGVGIAQSGIYKGLSYQPVANNSQWSEPVQDRFVNASAGFNTGLSLIWCDTDVYYYKTDTLYLAASDPVPVGGVAPDIDPAAFVNGWIFGLAIKNYLKIAMSDRIAKDAAYYVGTAVAEDGKYTALGDYSGATAIYESGFKFPQTVSLGDVYVCGDYEYRYNQNYTSYGWNVDDTLGGWGVRVRDNTKTKYEEILRSINGKNIVNMFATFEDCQSLVLPPSIPDTVTCMDECFFGCHSLTTAPILPNNVWSMFGLFGDYCSALKTYVGSTDADGDFRNYKLPDAVERINYLFWNCASIAHAPSIPDKVWTMQNTFSGCVELVTPPPVIPESVTTLNYTFKDCAKLTGTIEINANCKYFKSGCFTGTTQPITITGTSEYLEDLAATAENGNVTVVRT